jgi:hypothetical protein
LTKISRRKRRPTQNGVQAIFSGRSRRRGKPAIVAALISTGTAAALWMWVLIEAGSSYSVLLTDVEGLFAIQGAAFFAYSLAIRRTRRDKRTRFASYEFEDEIEPSRSTNPVPSRWRNPLKKGGNGSPLRIGRIFLAAVLAGIILTTVVGFSGVNSGSQHHTDPGASGSGTTPPVKTPPVRTMAPTFYAVANLAEALIPSNGTYTGTVGTSSDDFIIVQIAYSQGTGGNLPDIATVTDTQSSTFTRIAGASPGVAENFWEQVWTGRASSTTTSTNITASPDWLGCQALCVASVIMSMTISRYRGVAGVGAWTSIAPSSSSNSQSVNITATQANSMLVELLSHGAYSNCGIDAPQPDAGQTSRNCFTATTERTELFDHSISIPRTYVESYTWAQVEVQRGIYLELMGSSVVA